MEVRAIKYIWHTVTVILHEEDYPFLSVILLFCLVSHPLLTVLGFLIFSYPSLSSFLDTPPPLPSSLWQCFILFFLYFSSLTVSFYLNSCPSSPFLLSFFVNSFFLYVYVLLYLNHFFSLYHLFSSETDVLPEELTTN
jgi:hypothetical protein